MECVCVDIVRGSGNRPTTYILENAVGQRFKLTEIEVKARMDSGELAIINLKLECTCIDVIRGAHNKIEFYVLRNQFGDSFELYPNELKDSIKKGQIAVSNIKLTKDGKLRIIK